MTISCFVYQHFGVILTISSFLYCVVFVIFDCPLNALSGALGSWQTCFISVRVMECYINCPIKTEDYIIRENFTILDQFARSHFYGYRAIPTYTNLLRIS